VAADVCELMRPVAADNAIDLLERFSPDIDEVILDPRTLHRCLLNLVSNAIDACIYDDTGKAHHHVTVATAIESQGWLRFDISDNGVGMNKEIQDKLFASFFSTKGAKGTGLGLLVTRKLIDESGGSIDVTSTQGEGTTFTIRLPLETQRYPDSTKKRKGGSDEKSDAQL
jgi:signal transduction histidine kinase